MVLAFLAPRLPEVLRGLGDEVCTGNTWISHAAEIQTQGSSRCGPCSSKCFKKKQTIYHPMLTPSPEGHMASVGRFYLNPALMKQP